MAKKQKDSQGSGNPYNQTSDVGEEGTSGADNWTSYSEVKSHQGPSANPVNESENSQSGNVMGGPARNEPNPAGRGGAEHGRLPVLRSTAHLTA